MERRASLVGFAGWAGAVAALVVVSFQVESTFTSRITFTSDPESQQALEIVEAYRGEEPLFEQVIVSHPTFTADDPEFEAFVARVVEELRSHPDELNPQQTTSYFEANEAGSPFAQSLISPDRKTVLVPTMVRGALNDSADKVDVLREALAELRTGSDFSLISGGFATLSVDFEEAAFKDLESEQRVLPVAFVILVAVFGALVAAIVPMAIAAVSIGSAFMAITIIAAIWPLSNFVFNVTLMLGLAVGIDYALFIVGRFREERHRGLDKTAAITLAGDTASRAVLFSGGTVVIALLGMFIVPNSIFRSFAVGTITVVVFSVLVSLTLLPAALSLLGDNVNRLSIPFMRRAGHGASDTGFWAGAARTVIARPWLSIIASVGLLLALALPVLRIELGFSGPSQLPISSESRQAFEALSRDFVAGAASPTEIVVLAADVTSGPVQAAIEATLDDIQASADLTVLGAPEVSPDGELAIISFALPGESASQEAFDAFRRVRDDIVAANFGGLDARVLIGGETPTNSDFVDSLGTFTPIVFVFVLGLSFLLLMVVFRSLIVPLKAVLMNLLSVAAAYGVIVAIFQLGWGADALGFGTVEKIEAWLPLFLFTILFGLSMDYHVFLLSRIRESYLRTGDNAASVSLGLRSTANIITGAALIMVAVFLGFALGDLVMFQQMGVGLAVAVFLDATVVRTVLVPAAMELLGDWNWYLPRWLEWIPDLGVEESGPEAVATPPAPAPAGD